MGRSGIHAPHEHTFLLGRKQDLLVLGSSDRVHSGIENAMRRASEAVGEIVVGPEGNGVYIFDQERPEGVQVLNEHGYINSFYHQFHDFYSCVSAGKSPDASAEYALGEMKVALAMERSNSERTWVAPQNIV